MALIKRGGVNCGVVTLMVLTVALIKRGGANYGIGTLIEGREIGQE